MGVVVFRPVDKDTGVLISNRIKCHCGKQSPDSASWWTVQNWWKQHGYGRECG